MNTTPATSKLLLVEDQRSPATGSAVEPVRRYRLARLRLDGSARRPMALAGQSK